MFVVNVSRRRGGGSGFGRRRRERNGKMKRRLMRSLTPQGGSPWLQTYKRAHASTQTHKTNHYGKSTVKAVNP